MKEGCNNRNISKMFRKRYILCKYKAANTFLIKRIKRGIIIILLTNIINTKKN